MAVRAARQHPGDVGAFGDRLQVGALEHVALAAGRSDHGLAENRFLPFRVGPFDVRILFVDDVVTRAARRRRLCAVAIEVRRVRRSVRLVGDGVGVLSAHDGIVPEEQRVVVGADDRVDVVAIVTGDAAELFGKGGDAGARAVRSTG